MIRTSNYWLLLVIISVMFCTTICTKHLLNINEILINFYSEQFTAKQVKKLINAQKKWEWLTYAVIPLIILIRSSLVALCLSVGSFFYYLEQKIAFKKFVRIALLGEFVLVLVGVFKFGYFYFIKTDFSLQDLQLFFPLSYSNFLNMNDMPAYLVYPLQTINLFEIAYFFVLVYGLWKLLKNKYWKSFEIVAISYGTGLTIWVGLMMFLTLNFT